MLTEISMVLTALHNKSYNRRNILCKNLIAIALWVDAKHVCTHAQTHMLTHTDTHKHSSRDTLRDCVTSVAIVSSGFGGCLKTIN